MAKLKILVAVLNWGLGHASRSIPIIRALQKDGFEVVLASDGDALVLLRKEFPDLKWLELPSYRISYPREGKYMKAHFLLKTPQICKAVFSEKRLIENYISADGKFAGIISDNRLGAFSEDIPSVYMTHQIRLLSGRTTFITSKLHHIFMSRFSEIWVPDMEGEENLSGKMSHGLSFRKRIRYLGPLSRFTKCETGKKYDLLVLLSGPEPQRSLLESRLLQELSTYPGKVLFVRGKMEPEFTFKSEGGFTVCNFLTGKTLEEALNSSELVLARSGYSTIMDLSTLEKKAFFIPTPGQFEQEYLASLLEEKKIAPSCSQDEFTLVQLERFLNYKGFPPVSLPRTLPGVFALFKGK